MKKLDLKTGMMVEYNNGYRGIVLENVETRNYGLQKLFFATTDETGFMTGDSYSEDLICRGDKSGSYTIKKVYSVINESCILSKSLEGRKLLWERQTVPIEMTLEEACKKLREATGKPIKIIL